MFRYICTCLTFDTNKHGENCTATHEKPAIYCCTGNPVHAGWCYPDNGTTNLVCVPTGSIATCNTIQYNTIQRLHTKPGAGAKADVGIADGVDSSRKLNNDGLKYPLQEMTQLHLAHVSCPSPVLHLFISYSSSRNECYRPVRSTVWFCLCSIESVCTLYSPIQIKRKYKIPPWRARCLYLFLPLMWLSFISSCTSFFLPVLKTCAWFVTKVYTIECGLT